MRANDFPSPDNTVALFSHTTARMGWSRRAAGRVIGRGFRKRVRQPEFTVLQLPSCLGQALRQEPIVVLEFCNVLRLEGHFHPHVLILGTKFRGFRKRFRQPEFTVLQLEGCSRRTFSE